MVAAINLGRIFLTVYALNISMPKTCDPIIIMPTKIMPAEAIFLDATHACLRPLELFTDPVDILSKLNMSDFAHLKASSALLMIGHSIQPKSANEAWQSEVKHDASVAVHVELLLFPPLPVPGVGGLVSCALSVGAAAFAKLGLFLSKKRANSPGVVSLLLEFTPWII